MANADNEYAITQGDTIPIFKERLMDANGPIDLTNAAEIRLEVALVSGAFQVNDLNSGIEIIGDPVDGWIRCVWVPDSGDNEVPGRHTQEVFVKFQSGDTTHVPSNREGYPFFVRRQTVPST
jgi:hypothetical protein